MKAPEKKRVVIAGGSGFIGRALAADLKRRGYDVVVLTRMPRERADGIIECEWSGEHIGEWIKYLNGAEAVVNLAGRNIDCQHTSENLREIVESRVNSVKAIAAAFTHIKNPPPVWVQASAVGFYGDTEDVMFDETFPVGRGTLPSICKQWEATFDAVETPKTRHVTLRIGFVLGRDGGALPKLTQLTSRFLGGTVGSGRQFISWIHHSDLTKMFATVIEQEEWKGVFNATAPSPMTNREFMRELRHVLRRPWVPPAPTFLVKLAARRMKTESSLALISQRVVPHRFLKNGFKFRFTELAPAMKDLFPQGK